MMFGNFGFLSGLTFNNMKLTSVEVEKKLDNPDSTLEDLLVEEEIIQESNILCYSYELLKKRYDYLNSISSFQSISDLFLREDIFLKEIQTN